MKRLPIVARNADARGHWAARAIAIASVATVVAVAGWHGAAAGSAGPVAFSGTAVAGYAVPSDALGLDGLAPGAAPRAQAGASNPHKDYTLTTGMCALCHRAHTATAANLLAKPAPQSALCFSCHDGTGANSNVQGEYTDPNVPANVPATSSFYSHPSTTASNHTVGQEDEFAGVLNRHAECADCHNPHTLGSTLSASTSSGWTPSGALTGSAGVAASPAYSWKNPIAFEDELCFKCHSAYTTLLTYTKESYKKTDKLVEFDPANASYHPVEAAGKNATSQLASSLAGGSRWQFTTASTVRCVNCHGDYRPAAPAANARLAPHTSRYRGLLIANYRDRDLKTSAEAYDSADFSLCYLCHSEAPFTAGSKDPRPDTNFPLHGLHVGDIAGGGGGTSIDIDTPGAGQGNAICAECHYRTHSTKLAPWTGNQNYGRGVNFAPDVLPVAGQTTPLWSAANQNCTLLCHGENHNGESYAP